MVAPVKIKLASRTYDGTLPILRGQIGIEGFQFEITETEDVVGLTCTFFHGPDPMRQRRELLSVLESRYAGRAILGYQSGAELLAMRDLGFRDVGPLCVWLSTGSPSDGLATIDCVRPSPAR